MRKMRNRIGLTALIVSLSLFLASCAGTEAKPDAYCFSIVCGKSGEIYEITLNVKTARPAGGDPEDDERLKQYALSFFAPSLEGCLKEAADGEYDVYYKTVATVFFLSSVEPEARQVLLFTLLDRTAYQPRTLVFTPDTPPSDETVRELARKVCREESVRREDGKDYRPLVAVLREGGKPQ